MAHQVETMAYNVRGYGTPWHGLGTPVDGLMTAQQALVESGLDWTVEKKPMFLEDGTEVPNMYANVRDRDNVVLGVVGDRYRPLQNTEAFEFFDNVVQRDEAVYETAGSLAGGRKVWLLAKMPDHIRVGQNDDLIEKFVLLTNTHDGSKPVIAKVTPVRVVCNNTLSLALSSRTADEVKIRHSENMMGRLKAASEAIGVVNMIYAQVGDIFNAMAKKKLNVVEGEEFVKNALKLTEVEDEATLEVSLHKKSQITFDEVMRLVEEGAGSDMPNVRGSLWGYYNAITEYVDHVRPLQAKTERMDALVFGSGATIKQHAMAMSLELI